MRTDYLPPTDLALDDWATNFATTVTSSPTDYGLDAGQASGITTLASVYSNALLAATNPATRTSVTIAAKDSSRNDLVAGIRNLVKIVQAFPALTNDQRASLGITIKDPTPSPIPAPATKPNLNLLSTTANAAQLRIVDSATPTSRAKPFGAIACQVYAKIGGTAPLQITECDFMGNFTRIPANVAFTSAAAGNVVWMLGRWQTARGLVGPVSDPLQVTIPA